MPSVLIIDDTKNIRFLLATCLEAEGYTTRSAADAKEALAVLETERFDLIFLDIKLPGLSGTELLRQIRSQGIMTPVIIMTAFATVKNAVDCTKLGAIAYLQKPFTPEKIRNVLAESQAELVTGDPATAGALVQNLIQAGRLDQALLLLKRMLAINPSNAAIYRMLGEVYQAQGNEVEADRFYTIARQFPD